MFDKPKVGDILYSLNVGDAKRYTKQILTKNTVTRVGTKYFYCLPEGWRWENKYHIEAWREVTEYESESELYKTPQDWYDKKEDRDISIKIGQAFNYFKNNNKLSLENLRKIERIIDGA